MSKAVIRNVACLAIALGAAVGCGPKTDRLPLSGKVTLDGVPIDTGSIRFISQPGDKLQSTGAPIRNGSYEIPAEKSVLPGTFIVQINSPDTEAPPIMVGGEGGTPRYPAAPERIPDEYSKGDGNKVDVTPDGENVFDFQIISAAKK